jgi:ABC-2 type transport system ATP-binding protein
MDLGTLLVEGSPRELVERIGTSRVELLAPDATPRFEQALGALGGVVETARAGDVVTVTTQEAAATLHVIDQARELGRDHGLTVTLRSVTEATLESVFLQLTGRSMRDESD